MSNNNRLVWIYVLVAVVLIALGVGVGTGVGLRGRSQPPLPPLSIRYCSELKLALSIPPLCGNFSANVTMNTTTNRFSEALQKDFNASFGVETWRPVTWINQPANQTVDITFSVRYISNPLRVFSQILSTTLRCRNGSNFTWGSLNDTKTSGGSLTRNMSEIPFKASCSTRSLHENDLCEILNMTLSIPNLCGDSNVDAVIKTVGGSTLSSLGASQNTFQTITWSNLSSTQLQEIGFYGFGFRRNEMLVLPTLMQCANGTNFTWGDAWPAPSFRADENITSSTTTLSPTATNAPELITRYSCSVISRLVD